MRLFKCLVLIVVVIVIVVVVVVVVLPMPKGPSFSNSVEFQVPVTSKKWEHIGRKRSKNFVNFQLKCSTNQKLAS